MSFCRAFLLVLGIASGGCASLNYAPSTQSLGEYRDTTSLSRRADGMDSDDAAAVRVFIETYPDGIAPGPNGPVADPGRFDVLGRVTGSYKDPLLVDLGVWFYDYKEGERWRHPVCDWQVPLGWLTLTLWTLASPTFIPCRVGEGTPDERRADLVRALQKATRALGGNLVVIEKFEGDTHPKSLRVTPYLYATGYAFRARS
jgi:hypothetical protein